MVQEQCQAQTTHGNQCRKGSVLGGYCELHYYLTEIKPKDPKINKIRAENSKQRKRGQSIRCEVSDRDFELIKREASSQGFHTYNDYVRHLLLNRDNESHHKVDILWREMSKLQNKVFECQQFIGKVIGSEGITLNGKQVRFCQECGKQLRAKRDEQQHYCYACRQKREKEFIARKEAVSEKKQPRNLLEDFARWDRRCANRVRKNIGLEKLPDI